MVSIAINGFGRIGKNFLHVLLADAHALKHINLCAINIGTSDIEAIEYSIKYDTLLGHFKGYVERRGNVLRVNDKEIQLLTTTDATQLPWKSLGIDWVVDATGHYTHREAAQQHLASGAGAVLITAPAHGEDITIIPGVNNAAFDAQKHKIVSLGSCTTNAVVPLLEVIHKHCGIKQATMTTAHAYTNTQKLLDVDPSIKDVRRSRAAALNIIPSTTGASEVVVRVLPYLKERFTGISLRVPVPNVSLIDLVCTPERSISLEALHAAYNHASGGYLKNILAVSRDQLVSHDFQGDSHSVTLDTSMTMVNDQHIRVFGWYDNEWGYSSRLKDFLSECAERAGQ